MLIILGDQLRRIASHHCLQGPIWFEYRRHVPHRDTEISFEYRKHYAICHIQTSNIATGEFDVICMNILTDSLQIGGVSVARYTKIRTSIVEQQLRSSEPGTRFPHTIFKPYLIYGPQMTLWILEVKFENRAPGILDHAWDNHRCDTRTQHRKPCRVGLRDSRPQIFRIADSVQSLIFKS